MAKPQSVQLPSFGSTSHQIRRVRDQTEHAKMAVIKELTTRSSKTFDLMVLVPFKH